MTLAGASAAAGERAAADRPPARYTRATAAYDPPAVTLVDSGGDRVPLAEALGGDEPVMLQFVFTTCPAVCPVQSAAFASARDRLAAGEGPQPRLVSISIDPEHDTPERLREYAGRYGAGREWLFMTGRRADVELVQRAFDADYGGNKMAHLPLIFLRAEPGADWVRLEGFPSGADLEAEVRRLGER